MVTRREGIGGKARLRARLHPRGTRASGRNMRQIGDYGKLQAGCAADWSSAAEPIRRG